MKERGPQHHRVKGGRTTKLSASEYAAREAATREWLRLRQTQGNAPAARQLGYSDQQLSAMAKKLGLKIPPLGVGHTSARRALPGCAAVVPAQDIFDRINNHKAAR